MTTKNLLENILKKGVKKVIDRKSVVRKLKSGKKLRIKYGIDPTTPDLHLGYYVVFKKLKEFQRLGHKIIIIIGDFTARFGDPTDKLEARKLRSKEEVEKASKNYALQILKIFGKKNLEIKFNSQWYEKMSAEDLIKLMSYFSAAQMIQRDMFERRLKEKKEVVLYELVYPVLQAYDSVVIKSDLTVIGSDQEFNELQARRLQKNFSQVPQDLILIPLLTGLDGKKKMSQSLGNYIGIFEDPFSQYGKIMSIPDSLIGEYFELLTDFSVKEIKKIKDLLTKGKVNPRDLKMKLAYEIVKELHSEKKAKKAQEKFIDLFQKKQFRKVKEIKIKKNTLLRDFLTKQKIISSNSEFARLIKSGAISFENQKINDLFFKITKSGLLKVGKKNFIKLKI